MVRRPAKTGARIGRGDGCVSASDGRPVRSLLSCAGGNQEPLASPCAAVASAHLCSLECAQLGLDGAKRGDRGGTCDVACETGCNCPLSRRQAPASGCAGSGRERIAQAIPGRRVSLRGAIGGANETSDPIVTATGRCGDRSQSGDRGMFRVLKPSRAPWRASVAGRTESSRSKLRTVPTSFQSGRSDARQFPRRAR